MSFGKCHHGFEATSCALCQQERNMESMRIQQENERRHREAMRIQEKQYELAKERESRERYENEQRRRQSSPFQTTTNYSNHNSSNNSNYIEINSIDVFMNLNNNLELLEVTGGNINNSSDLFKSKFNNELYSLIREMLIGLKNEIENALIKEAIKFGSNCPFYREGWGGNIQVKIPKILKSGKSFNFYFTLLHMQKKFHVDPDKLEKTTFYGHKLIDKAFKDGVRMQINSPNYETPIEKHIPEWFENLLNRHPLMTLIIIASLLIWILDKFGKLFG